jgi:hypothetical protein
VPKRYPEEFRRKVLDLVAAGRPVAQVAADLGISDQTIYVWPRQRQQFRSLLSLKFCELNVFHHPDLEVHESHGNEFSILLLGYAFDPDHPERSNQEIADRLSISCMILIRYSRNLKLLLDASSS